MQTSTNPKEWAENPTDQQMRIGIHRNTPDVLKRRLYPLSGRVKTNRIYAGLRNGSIIRFVRTKLTPSPYPIEVLHFDAQGHRMNTSFDSDEIELMNPLDES